MSLPHNKKIPTDDAKLIGKFYEWHHGVAETKRNIKSFS